MGKSAIAGNIAVSAANAGCCVGIFTLEMSKDQVFDRMVAARSGVNTCKFRTGHFGKSDWQRIIEATGKLHNLPIHFDDTPGPHYMELRRQARLACDGNSSN